MNSGEGTNDWNRHARGSRGQDGSAFAATAAGFTLLELLIVIAIVGVLASLLLPVVGRTQRKARETSCVSNLRQLGVGLALYADDHGGRLPFAEPLPSHPVATNPPLPGIRAILSPYVAASAGVFRCPEDKVGRFEREGTSYEWNYLLNGKLLHAPSTEGAIPVGSDVFFFGSLDLGTSKMPLLYDYENFHLGSRGSTNGVRAHKNAVFADGHVAAL
jgi:prepilin-type N-terminal cleavage/methylation domain-containing protein/prepilin-type processing-associated H-X9-DG protein